MIGKWLAGAALGIGAMAAAQAARAETILFVGNSFTFGADSPVWKYRADTVTDLNGEGVGGVPALFKLFADQAGLDYQVSLETAPGRSLEWHWRNRAKLLDRRWDHVVLQDYSTLNPERPGDPEKLIAYSGLLAGMFVKANPAVKVGLTSTWSRPDLTFQAGKPWSGRSIYRMALDLRASYDKADAANAAITRVHPAGQAFNCAIAMGVADANPYDGIAYGQVGLWAYDHYHGSAAGYYLTALTVFAGVTGHDPRTLGKGEQAADELGIAPDVAVKLQEAAWRAVNGDPCTAGERG